MSGVSYCLALSLVIAELAGARREKLATSFSPYGPASPLHGWSYYLESERKEIWPSCNFRFLSSSKDCSTVDLWQAAGENQNFHLEEVPNSSSTFYLKTACGNYLSYSGTCSKAKVDTWQEAGANQQFRIKALGSFKWSLEAVGRASCETKFLSFPSDCENHAVQLDAESSWLLHPATGDPNQRHFTNTGGCADPFVWHTSEGKLHMICTGGDLPLYEASAIAPDVTFKKIGSMLGGEKATWASNGARWAPENLEVDKNLNALVFSDQQDDGKQRVGWVLSFNGTPGSWSTYSSGNLNLGNRPGGEIDPHIFVDEDGQKYLVWKSDDNSVGDTTTRIWAQACTIDTSGVTLQGTGPTLLAESPGLWWVDSFTPGGALIEGPEIIRRGSYYYLFFASGRFCQSSYSENVARSTKPLGPYEKLGVPLLSTAMVGYRETGEKLEGPGHAAYMKDSDGQWYVVWHAAKEGTCERQAWVDKMDWTEDGWPYVSFTPMSPGFQDENLEQVLV